MPIAVACKCGKKFKVKDELAGKAVRCPDCKSPLKIPGAGVPVAASTRGRGGSSAPAVDEKAAMLKFEEAQKKKQLTAEEEAKYREEQKKLIDSYDQLAGKGAATKDGKPAPRPTEVVATKPTIFTKIADLFGAIFGTFIAKYVIIIGLVAAGVVGSVMLVQYVGTYVHDETSAKMSNEERAKLYMTEAEEAVKARRWSDAKEKLDAAIRLNKRLEIRREYREMRDQVTKGLAAESK